MAYARGDRLQQYEILGVLGKGGMGEVYHARDTVLGRDVAIKVSFSQFTARFKREAAVIASLNHPNICTLFEAGPDYLVMELVEGPTLAERLKAGPIPVDEAIEIARQIAAALEAAHEKPVIHRDLKPANIKIRPDGLVKVLDFGLAKNREPDAENDATVTMGMSVAGTIMGTPAYMSPEQARGLDVDRRSDIWAYGVLLYEMTTGKRLFDGPTLTDILASVVAKDVSFEDAPSKVRRLLKICVEKDPKKRLRDIGEAWRHIGEEPAPVQVIAASEPAKRNWLWPVLTGVGLASAAAAVVWMVIHPRPEPQLTRFEIHAPKGSTLPMGTPAVSPDGRTLVYTMTGADNVTSLHVRSLDTLETRELPGTEGAVHPFFSPDGRSVAFVSRNQLQRVDLAGGSPQVLMGGVTGPWHGSWSNTGTLLVVSPNLSRVSASGGTVEQLYENKNFPFFLRDGTRFLTRAADGEKSSIQLGTLESKETTMVLDNVFSAPLIAPSPDGDYLLYLRDDSLMAQRFDQGTAKLSGESTVLLDNIARVASPAYMPAVGVGGGTLALQRGGESEYLRLTWFDRTGKRLSDLTNLNDSRVALSPDGKFAAFVRFGGRQNGDVWVTDLTRNVTSRLTFGPTNNDNPVWTADGKRVVYRKQGKGIFEKYANGGGEERLIMTGDGSPASFSADGKFLLFRLPGNRLSLLPMTGDKKPVPVGSANAPTGSGAISPDGKFIAFSAAESGRYEVYVQPMPPATGRWQVSQGGGALPRWRADGKELFFRGPTQETMAVDVKLGDTFSAGIPQVLFKWQNTVDDYAVSPDGQRFLYRTAGSDGDSPIVVLQNWWLALKK